MSQENVEKVRYAYEAFQAGRFTEMLGSLDPDFVIVPAKEFPGPARSVYRGHEGFLEFLADWFEPWDQYSIELEELIDAGDRVITVEHHVGRREGTGLEVAQLVSDIWTIKGGALVGCRVFLDKAEALEAAGLQE